MKKTFPKTEKELTERFDARKRLRHRRADAQRGGEERYSFYELVAQDDALDLLHQFIGAKLLRAEHAGERERLRTLRDLDASALRLREIGLIVLDPLHADAELRTAIFARIPREQLEKDVATIRQYTDRSLLPKIAQTDCPLPFSLLAMVK